MGGNLLALLLIAAGALLMYLGWSDHYKAFGQALHQQ